LLRVYSIQAGLGYAHLIECDRNLILVDAGSPNHEGKILREIRSIDRSDLRLIFITHAHFDHYGSAAALRQATGAPIAIHHLDSEAMEQGQTSLGIVRGRGKLARLFLPLYEKWAHFIPPKADLEFSDGDDLGSYGIEAKVVHTPGHTPGSASLLVEGRIAFVGDLLSARGRPHAQRYYAYDWDKLAESVELVKRISPELTYTGHARKPLDREALNKLSVM
jgi:hydroxyacylglutathione hydrolase